MKMEKTKIVSASAATIEQKLGGSVFLAVHQVGDDFTDDWYGTVVGIASSLEEATRMEAPGEDLDDYQGYKPAPQDVKPPYPGAGYWVALRKNGPDLLTGRKGLDRRLVIYTHYAVYRLSPAQAAEFILGGQFYDCRP